MSDDVTSVDTGAADAATDTGADANADANRDESALVTIDPRRLRVVMVWVWMPARMTPQTRRVPIRR